MARKMARKPLSKEAAQRGEEAIERQFVDHDIFGTPISGPVMERRGDRLATRVRRRIARQALATFDPFDPAQQRRNRDRPVRAHEQAAVHRAAAVRATRGDKPWLKAAPSYIGTGMNRAHQLSRGVTREIGDLTKLTTVRDTAERVLNPRSGEGKLRALGRAAARTALRAPLIPGMMAQNALRSGGEGIGLKHGLQEARESLGENRKRRLLGKFALSTAVLWTAETAFHLATLKHGGHVPMPDFSSIPSFIGSIPGAVGDTWQTAAEGIVKAPGAISDHLGDIAHKVHEHYEETKAPKLPPKQ